MHLFFIQLVKCFLAKLFVFIESFNDRIEEESWNHKKNIKSKLGLESRMSEPGFGEWNVDFYDCDDFR